MEIDEPLWGTWVREWYVLTDYHVTDFVLPDFPNIEGTPGIGPGMRRMIVMRAYREGFDIDNYSYGDLDVAGLRSWSVSRAAGRSRGPAHR